ncbi:MAG: non-ribosomal peptide synthetase, partial [Calditrichaeota bacterium]
MNTENIQDIYPLSPMQQGMLFHTIYSPDLGTYVEQTEVEISGALNQSAFIRAWQAVVDRNPILRTCFVWENVDEPLQVVFKQVELPVMMEDWRGKSSDIQKRELHQFLLRDRKNGFNLTSPPLMRLAL